MRKAALASAGIHLGLIAGAWVVLNLEPTVDESAAESLAVEIISMDAVSTEPSEVITSATQTLLSAGAEQQAMEVPEVEPVDVAETEPVPATAEVATVAPVTVVPSESEDVASAAVLTVVAEAVEPAETAPQVVSETASAVVDSAKPSQSDPLEAIRTASISEFKPEPEIQKLPEALLQQAETVKKVETASLAPMVEEVTEVIPVPKPRIVRKQVEAEPVKEQPKPTKEEPKKKPQKQANLGKGGKADADQAAGKTSAGGQGKKDDGGSAAVSKYPGLVQSKVTRAAKAPSKGKGGEALVSFTVAAGGNVVKVALARSSGNPALDDAAIAAVNRAAPFPPIPADAGRSSWSFTVPIYFKK